MGPSPKNAGVFLKTTQKIAVSSPTVKLLMRYFHFCQIQRPQKNNCKKFASLDNKNFSLYPLTVNELAGSEHNLNMLSTGIPKHVTQPNLIYNINQTCYKN